MIVTLLVATCSTPVPTPNPAASLPVDFPLNLPLITGTQNQLLCALASYDQTPDGTEVAVFVPVDTTSDMLATIVTSAALQFGTTTSIDSGFAFDDGFGSGSVVGKDGRITVSYKPGDAPVVTLPSDWPADLVPVSVSGATWRPTSIQRGGDTGTELTAVFLPDPALPDAQLAADLAANVHRLGASPAANGDGYSLSADGGLGSWLARRGGFVVAFSAPTPS